MRVVVLTLCAFFLIGDAKSQNCDIAQTGMAIVNAANSSPVSTVTTGQEINFKFSVANFGTSSDCSIPAFAVTVTLDFPTLPTGTRPYIYTGASTFNSGYFTWTYSVIDQVLKGVNTVAIPAGQGDANVLVKAKAIAPGIGQSSLKIVPANGLTDNDANNTSSARVQISGVPLPIRLGPFTAIPDNCTVQLNWSTLTEIDFSHFEVEFSLDGVKFEKVGTVNAKGISTGSNYSFAYTPAGRAGQFRLKLVDKDGKIEYSDVLRIATNCNGKAGVTVFPNPVNRDQKILVNINGLPGKVRGELYNSAGQKISDYSFTTGTNSIPAARLSAGVYLLYVMNDAGDQQPFKIVVTK
jgi:hypothetical protein